jgi:hypothetical protein
MNVWVIATLGMLTCGWTPRDEARLPFELSRVEHSQMGWNTGGRTTWWEYTAKYHGKSLSFTAPKHDRWGDTDSPETFTHCNEGYALGKHEFFDGAKKQRICAEALLLNMGPDPNNFPRWFLLNERAGHLDATWLASPGGDPYPIWQVWASGQKQPVPEGESLWLTRASLGVLPLRSYQVKMALPETNTPRFLSVDGDALVDVASLEVARLPELKRGEQRIDPLGLSPDGDVLLFHSRRGEASAIEQVAWKTGESRWLPLDYKKRHLRNMEDGTPEWMAVALAWKPEKEGGLHWAQWREGGQYPVWTGRLSNSEYDLDGYRAEILDPLLKMLVKECGAVLTAERPAYPLDPGEVEHQVILDGETLHIGFTKSHGVSVFPAHSSREPKALQAVARVAALIDKNLREGKWQEFADL